MKRRVAWRDGGVEEDGAEVSGSSSQFGQVPWNEVQWQVLGDRMKLISPGCFCGALDPLQCNPECSSSSRVVRVLWCQEDEALHENINHDNKNFRELSE